ncbi:hypothetical protein NYE48_05065 [Paenibacillus sp. FSL M7-1455]|uniref:hypothetical protein n=1 Tax=Paenibacillus sp. FSL M7-1455 TaxID=2975316 RepID=UPI0030FBE224
MKFTKLIEDLEIIIEYKIKDAIGRTISELNRRNMLTAAFASDDIITSGFIELNNQIISNIEEFSKLKLLKKGEIIVLKKQINIIIENQSILLFGEATKLTSHEPNYLKLEHFKKESKRIMNLQIERLLREKKQKTISFWWDLSKIADARLNSGHRESRMRQ